MSKKKSYITPDIIIGFGCVLVGMGLGIMIAHKAKGGRK